MTAYYLDSSGLMKRYAQERGTAFVINLMRPSAGNLLYAAQVTEIEVCAALSRRRKGLRLTARHAAKAIARVRRVFARRFFAPELTAATINEAIRLTDVYALRGYDALQLATALEINRKRVANGLPVLVFVSADKELNAAATTEGLSVENPNNYP